jgi:hypothetical protein
MTQALIYPVDQCRASRDVRLPVGAGSQAESTVIPLPATLISTTAMRAGGCVIWEAAHRLGLYGLNDAELETLIQHAGSSLPDARIAAEAGYYVRHLRIGLADGDGC